MKLAGLGCFLQFREHRDAVVRMYEFLVGEYFGSWLMLLTLEVITVFLVALEMTMALAHALEFPGKLRLNEQTYMAVQTIYYQGFTLAGIGEVLSVIATLILVVVMRNDRVAFWWALAGFVAVLAMHAVFWLITQPVNRYWLKNQQLGTAGARFFGLDRAKRTSSNTDPNWKNLRNRWEYSHIARAVLSSTALIMLVVAIAT